MNKEVKELRKAGFLSGIEVSYFGEIISSKTRKFYNGVNKIKGQNLEIFNKVLKECKRHKVSNITVLKCNSLVGDYGRVVSDAEVINERHIGSHIEAPIKYIYNILRGFQNSHNMSRYLFIPIDTNDGKPLYHLFYIPEEYKIFRYGESEDEILIKIHNGQYFDVGNSYYYSKVDSKELKQYIKDHGYDGPNDFYNYMNPYSDYEESEGCPE